MGDTILLLIDGTAVAYRAFYAIRDLSTSDGRPTNALYGFVRMLGQLKDIWRPTHWAVAFDGGLPEERTSVLETYKAHREPMPDPLVEQLDAIDEYLLLAPVPTMIVDGEEADDVMATLARQAEGAGAEVLIATSDKDMFQVVDDHVFIVPPSKAGSRMGPEDIRDKTGVLPGQIPAWLALVGDSVDNIPGVPGVGPKTAARLLGQYGTLEGIWEHLAEVTSEKLRKVLTENRPIVERNVGLVRLRTDLSCPLDWDALAVRPPDMKQLVPFFEQYELRSLAGSHRGER